MERFFQESWVEVLAARCSDHRPLLLCMNQKGNKVRRGRKLFRYEANWALEEDCVVALKRVWEKRTMEDVTPKNLLVSLSDSKRALMSWWKKNGKDRGSELKLKTQLLKMLQENENSHNSGEIKRLRKEIGLLLEKEDFKWRQRAKVNWYQLGDKNPKFFHSCASQRRRKNKIAAVKDDQNIWHSRHEKVEGAFNKYFGSLFTSSSSSQMEIDDCLKYLEARVIGDMNEALTKTFSKNEVEDALKQIAPLKSLGPNCFGACFYQSHWPIIGEEVNRTVLSWLNGDCFDSSANFTYIVLIPKVSNPSLVSEYQTISLCNVAYKIMAKVLANRLKTVLADLISPNQSTKFCPSKGLRQGDPLSPYLFILYAEGLSSLLNVSDLRGDTRGVTVARGGTRVNHLLFADDCVLLGRAKVEEWKKLKAMLLTYEKASGQVLNKDKFALFFSPNTCPREKELIKEEGGAVMVGYYGKYLGLPSVVGRSKYLTFRGIKERVWKKINNWKNSFLSSAGKEILIKAVLQAVPTYTMSVFQLPNVCVMS
ncbi:uncharacterized protein LOC121242376 [Juglans microcarpa x Juglans regia]|uniref:uncharacterized protein LOC121242376 n=1 Tax=Juglans microcarpa x Juglans regia TaxID=2249226 RepID=UPI001B7E2B53|nr:uncharacterized protein LOC121242376 [Juglans microcarpa x Juglans regia]